MTNRKFNIVAGLIGIALLVVLINVLYIYRRNEASKIYFNLSDINNSTWKSEDITFKLDNNKLTFIIDDENIINNETISFNNKTGKIEVSNKQIYLRSVSDDSIIIWYNKQEFNLDKEFIAK